MHVGVRKTSMIDTGIKVRQLHIGVRVVEHELIGQGAAPSL